MDIPESPAGASSVPGEDGSSGGGGGGVSSAFDAGASSLRQRRATYPTSPSSIEASTTATTSAISPVPEYVPGSSPLTTTPAVAENAVTAATDPAPPAHAQATATPATQAELEDHSPRAPAHLVVLSTVAAGLGICLSAGAVVVLLVADVDRLLPLVAAVCVAAFASILFRVAVAAITPPGNGTRNRFRRATRHFTGERAAYVRTSQRLAMLDRDFTAADYEMLLDLDNNSQRLRQFLEGASEETIERLPTYTYSKPKRKRADLSQSAEGTIADERVNPRSKIDLAELPPRGGEGDQMDNNQLQKEDPIPSSQPTTTSSSPSIVSHDSANPPRSLDDQALLSGTAHALEIQQSKESSKAPAAGKWDTPGCAGGETATRCTICLEPFDNGMLIRILPCMHQFMAQCIDPWLVQQAKCPVCKGAAFPDQIDELRGYS